MSALAEHPNAVEAREHRRNCVLHAARCLYRDPDWLDPDGNLAVWTWLCEIHYMRGKERRDQMRGWLREARVDGATPIAELTLDERTRLIRQMLDFYNAEGGR